MFSDGCFLSYRSDCQTYRSQSRAATVIVAAVAVFAAISIAKSFGMDEEASFTIAFWMIGIGVAVIVAANIINDPIMQKIIGYTLTFCVCAFAISLLVATVFGGTGGCTAGLVLVASTAALL